MFLSQRGFFDRIISMLNITLSVHDFVDLILRKGDLDNRVFNTLSMLEGTRLHELYQSKQGPEYNAEYYLQHDFYKDEFHLDMSGRADGVIIHENDNITIDEIKTTNTDIDEFYKAQKAWHLGQAQVYAYIYLKQHALPSIKVQLTYISQEDTTRIKQYIFIYQAVELEKIIDGYLDQYIAYLRIVAQMKQKRQETIAKMEFPFPSLRPGQKELMDFAKLSVESQEICFCEAKTGIGKTISVLYPYIQELGSENLEKIFYLTSRNSIKQVVYETMMRLISKGLSLKTVLLTSKDRICLNTEAKRHCNPDECPFCKNYYDKVNEAIFEAYKEQDIFRMEDIVYYARKYQICPFELQLDMLSYADLIVGDYNYLFDPNAKLSRFFENYSPNPFLLLVDEAHNLPDRVRDMFSNEISVYDLLDLKKKFVGETGTGSKSIRDDINKLIEFFENQQKGESSSRYQNIEELKEIPDKLIDLLNDFVNHGKKYMKKRKKINDAFLDFYYQVQHLLSLPKNDDKWAYYLTYSKKESEYDESKERCLSFSVSCLDPRPLEKAAYDAFEAGILFSATLMPKDYFIDVLGGNEDSKTLYLPSPFDAKNCLVMADPYISTKYKDRDSSLGAIVGAIRNAVSGKVGNYFVFFPSFEYLSKVLPYFNTDNSIQVYAQKNYMTDEEREQFLGHFVHAPSKTTLGFIVLGGIFGEGIDLTEDRLIGAIIISVGLPKINYISDRIQAYFGQDDQNAGYSYAYVYPGINKVLQAAGRVIRSEKDKGIILYIDTRYGYSVYKKQLETTYGVYNTVRSPYDIYRLVQEFWKKGEN